MADSRGLPPRLVSDGSGYSTPSGSSCGFVGYPANLEKMRPHLPPSRWAEKRRKMHVANDRSAVALAR